MLRTMSCRVLNITWNFARILYPRMSPVDIPPHMVKEFLIPYINYKEKLTDRRSIANIFLLVLFLDYLLKENGVSTMFRQLLPAKACLSLVSTVLITDLTVKNNSVITFIGNNCYRRSECQYFLLLTKKTANNNFFVGVPSITRIQRRSTDGYFFFVMT